MRSRSSRRWSLGAVACAAALALVDACSGQGQAPPVTGSAGATAGASGSAGVVGAAGAGTAGANGAAGISSGTGVAGANGAAGAGGAAGVGAAGSATDAGATGLAGASADGGPSSETDPPAPRPINITPGGGCDCDMNVAGGKLGVDTTKTIQGKLVITLGGICGGPGGGGLEGTAKALGFHVWQPPTQTCVNSAPQMYKDIIAKTPNDPEANRQVGDARMELWDGVDRVNWVTVNKGDSIVERTVAALKAGMAQDPGGDWGYYFNADGTVRWTDVFMLGYSWGSQTIAMVSKYVRFGRVFCTSGPQAEGFPNATWISQPSATPVDRLFMAVGFDDPYPSTDSLDIAPNTVTSMIETVMKAGWIGPPKNVLPGDTGPYNGFHMFPMIARFPYSEHAPGGHGIFCNNDPMSGWAALCAYAFNAKP
jgi:hypothetical protein